MFYLKQNSGASTINEQYYDHFSLNNLICRVVYLYSKALCIPTLGFLFYIFYLLNNPFCLTFQRAALDCTTAGWGTCTFIGVDSEMRGLTVSPVELIMGRTVNGTCFGGQFFPPLLIFSKVVLKFL